MEDASVPTLAFRFTLRLLIVYQFGNCIGGWMFVGLYLCVVDLISLSFVDLICTLLVLTPHIGFRTLPRKRETKPNLATSQLYPAASRINQPAAIPPLIVLMRLCSSACRLATHRLHPSPLIHLLHPAAPAKLRPNDQHKCPCKGAKFGNQVFRLCIRLCMMCGCWWFVIWYHYVVASQ